MSVEQPCVGGPGDRRHDAHETVGASCIPKVGRPELGLGPITGFIEHVRSLARPPRAAGSARDMRSLAHKRKMWVTVRVRYSSGWGRACRRVCPDARWFRSHCTILRSDVASPHQEKAAMAIG